MPRLREDLRRLDGAPGLEQRASQVAVGGGIIGLLRDGLAERLDRFVGPTESE